MKHLLVLNGPNLNLLGKREPEIYGNLSFEDYVTELKSRFSQVQIDYKQSNSEGVLIDTIHIADKYDGIILNAGAYTHTSIALHDAIMAIDTPVIEVHISNVYQRESFRHKSFIAPACQGVIAGFGLESYAMAIQFFFNR